MKLEFKTLDEFIALGLRPTNVYGSEGFMRLNADRADRLVCAVGDGRIGIVMGERDGLLRAPWSAPFMALSVAAGIERSDIQQFGTLLRTGLSPDVRVRIVTPPKAYSDVEDAFFDGFARPSDNIITDTSFHFDLASELRLSKLRRRNLRDSIKASLKLERTDCEECYNLIAHHHATHGYTMAMSCRQVAETSEVLPVDFWAIRQDNRSIAAVYCYKVRPDVVQIINLGDTEYGRQVHAMTFLTQALFDHYRATLVEAEGIADAILDFGPTSVEGIQNEGLAAYKTSFGAIMTPKRTLLT